MPYGSWRAESFLGLPFAGVRAAVYVQDFAGSERRVCQEQNGIYDFLDFPHPAEGMQPFEKLVGLGFMHWSFDDTQRDGVYSRLMHQRAYEPFGTPENPALKQ
jgi:hypothetical protein